ncbi:MAG TPA: FAD-binding oxidoreductase, partial [Limnochordia bacterium]
DEPAGVAAFAVDGIVPRWVARPLSVEAAAAVVGAADRLGLAVVPRGGGTHMSWARVPERVDVVVDLSALDRPIDVQPADMTITVEAGMRLSELQATLAEHGQFLPLDPPTSAAATVGGLIATNPSGPLRFGFGTVRDYLIGVRVIRANGEITKGGGRVVKNVAGYELCKLYTGSFGTLGVIVEATFKVRPRPPAGGLVGAVAGGDEAEALIAALMDSDADPQVIELVDRAVLDLLPLRPLAEAAGAARYAVLAGFMGASETVAWQVERARQLFGPRAVELPWEEGLTCLREAAMPGRDGAITFRGHVLSSRTVPFCEAARAIAQEHGFRSAIVAHAGNGDVTVHLWPTTDTEPDLDAAVAAHAALLAEAGRPASGSGSLGPEPVATAPDFDARPLGAGTCTILAAPAALRQRVPVFGPERPEHALMRAIKAKLDPRDTLNRGRFLDGG